MGSALVVMGLMPQLRAADESRGIITGTVSNAATGQNLEGAIVRLTGSPILAAARRDGTYTLRNVPSGTHELVATYTGLEQATASVTVAPGRTAQRDLALTAEIYRLAPVTVSSVREGDALATRLSSYE